MHRCKIKCIVGTTRHCWKDQEEDRMTRHDQTVLEGPGSVRPGRRRNLGPGTEYLGTPCLGYHGVQTAPQLSAPPRLEYHRVETVPLVPSVDCIYKMCEYV